MSGFCGHTLIKRPFRHSLAYLMSKLRVYFRLTFFVCFTARIVAEIWLKNRIWGTNMRRSMQIRRYWAKILLRRSGVRIQVFGEVPSQVCLLVGNHRSYLDPIILLRDLDAMPVAMAEIASWPLIGKGAAMCGILFLRRDDMGHRSAMVNKIATNLKQGFPVILYPEGTTSGEAGVLPFLKAGFIAAIRNQFPVVPVAITFEDMDDYWIDDEPFLWHALRRFRKKQIRIALHYGQAITGNDVHAVADQARNWIESVVLEHHQNAASTTS